MKILAIILGVALLAAIGGVAIQNRTESTTPQNNTSAQVEANITVVRGSATYPSEGIPSNLKVCAENTETALQTCTDDLLEGEEFIYNKGYELSLEDGKYTIYALEGDNKAYYNKYVQKLEKTGEWSNYSTNNCDSYHPLTIDTSNYNNEDIVVGDWYFSNYCS